MEIKLILALMAALLAVVGNVPYIRDILKRKVKPHLYSWFLWSIVSSVAFFGQLLKGAGFGAIPTGVSALFTILIFLFSFKYGFKGIKKQDTIFLTIALIGIIPWIITNDPTISVLIVVGIDLVAFIPTMIKTYSYPLTEDSILYGTNSLRHIMALFALQAYNVATVSHSLVMVVVNTIMVAVIYVRSKKRK